LMTAVATKTITMAPTMINSTRDMLIRYVASAASRQAGPVSACLRHFKGLVAVFGRHGRVPRAHLAGLCADPIVCGTWS
jgi:hypothetical protein